MSHPANIYNTLEQLLEDCCPKDDGSNSYIKSKRFWTKVWNNHVEKHGNVPYIMKCGVCSGQEHKHDVKCGKFKESTREEQKERIKERNYWDDVD